MKDRVKISLIVVFLCVITAFGLYVMNYKVEKTYSTDTGIVSIQEFVDEEDNPTKVSFVLEDLNIDTMQITNTNKYKITSSNTLLLFKNTQTGESIETTDGIVLLGSDGVTVTANTISRGNKYNISIEPVSTEYGYGNEFKKAVLTIDYTDKLNAYVKEVIGKDGNNVEIDNKAILLYTDENDKVKLRANSDMDIEYIYSLTELSDEQLSQANFTSYDKNNYLAIQTNGYLYAKAKYKTNGYSKINKLHITCIDKLDPLVVSDSVTLNADNESATVSYTLDDAEATLEYGKSEVKSYAFSPFARVADDRFIEVTDTLSFSSVVDENGTYYIHVKDNAGNVTSKKVIVDIIPERPEEYCIIILESPNSELTGMLFKSLREMSNKFDELGLTSNDHVLAQILKNISNQNTVIDNINLTMDLNGYTISSNKEQNIFNVSNGSTLKFVDYRYSISDYLTQTSWNGIEYSQFVNGTDSGSIIATSADAIDVDAGGTLILGEDNSPDLLHIEYPDHTSPYIEGKDQGIMNNGTFNYYDGVIVGGISVNGLVTDTPYLYDPSVVVNDQLQKYYMTLEKVTNIEALIGKTRFTFIEDAIAYANNRIGTSDDQIEIDVVADLDKPATVEVDNTKNIIIDLNGHHWTISSSQTILSNSGKVKIIDSGDDGLISNATADTIHNNTGAYLEIADGTIQATSYSGKTIVNHNQAELLFSGGTLNCTSTNNYGIYNKGGKLTITGGELNSNKTVVWNEDVTVEGAYDTEISIPVNSMYSAGLYPYPFIYEDGKMKSSNYGNRNTGSAGYYILDLTNENIYDQFEITLNVTVPRADTYYRKAYIHVDETEELTWSNYSYITKPITEEQNANEADRTFEVSGGKKYYIHVGYTIRDYYTDENDSLIINSVKYSKKHIDKGEVHFDGGTINGVVSFENRGYYKTIYVTGSTINGEFGNTYGGVEVSGGNLLGVTRHGYKTDNLDGNINDFVVTGGYIADLYNTACYSDYGIKKMYISGGEIGNFTNGYYKIYNNQAIITGGTFNGTITNYGYFDMENAYVKGKILNTSGRKHWFNVKNTTFEITPTGNESYYSITTNALSESNISNSTFTFNTDTFGSGSPTYNAIINESDKKLTLNNVTMNLSINDTYDGSRGTNKSDNLIGVYNKAFFVDVDIINSNITATTTSPDNLLAYDVYNLYKGTLNIGSKDGNYDNTTCKLTSSYKSIYNDSTSVNLYDGYLKGKAKAIDSTICNIEDGYFIHSYEDSDYKIIDLSKQATNNVLNVEKNKYYNSIVAALAEASTNDTLRVMVDNYYEPRIVVSSDKNVTIDFNDKHILLGGIENNGIVTLTDGEQRLEENDIQSGLIINNNTLSFAGGRYVFEMANEYSIRNNGTMNTGNTYITTNTKEVKKFYHEKYDGSVIYNTNTLNINDGTKLDSSLHTEYLVANKYTGTVNLNGGQLLLERLYNSGHTGTIGIYNSGIVNVKGGTTTYDHGTAIYSTAEYIGPTILPQDSSLDYECEFFEDSGKLKSNCSDVYFPVDLTNKSGTYTFTAYVSTVIGNETNIEVSQYTTAGSSIKMSVPSNATDNIATQKWSAGKKYYVYFNASREYSNLYDFKISNGEDTMELFAHGVVNMESGTVGNITAYNSTVNVSGGNIRTSNSESGYYRALDARKFTTVNMTGGNILCDGGYGIYANTSSNINITNGTISNANVGILSTNRSNVTIDDITINNSTYGISTSGNTVMNNGTITSSAENGGVRGVLVGANATFTMNDGNINLSCYGENADSCYGITTDTTENNTSYNIIVKSGTIITTGTNTNKSFYGIYGYNNATTNLQLGVKDTEVSTTSPSIRGATYGIYKKNGTFKYYDGIIKGTEEDVFYGGVTERPTDYELFYDTEDSLNTVILKKFELIEKLDDHSTYASLYAAFIACEDNVECNLKVLYPFQISGTSYVLENKIVNLDLNGLTITALSGKYISNMGNLKIFSHEGTEGRLEIASGSEYESIITNYGTLEIADGVVVDTKNFTKVRAILNEYRGTFNMTGGKITGTGKADWESGTGLYNRGGIVNLSGGEIVDESGSGNHSIIANAHRYTSRIKTISSGFTTTGPFYDYIQIPTKGSGNNITYGEVYFPIDLTEVQGKVTLEVGAEGSWLNPRNGDKLFIAVRESLYSTRTEIINNADAELLPALRDPKGYKTELEGGKLYYLMFTSSSTNPRINCIKYYNDDFVYDFFQGEMNLTGTKIISNSNFGIHNLGATLNYTGGEIKSSTGHNGYGIFVDSGSTVNITNRSIDDKQYGIYVNDFSSYINVNGLTINNTSWPSSTHGIYNKGSRMDIDGFNMTVTNAPQVTKAIYIGNGVAGTYKNLNINISGSSNEYYGIHMEYNNDIILQNSNINITATDHTYYLYGVYMNANSSSNINNSIKVESSTISARGDSDKQVYGILSKVQLSTNSDTSYYNDITLGVDDGVYNPDDVLVYGSTMGIYKRYGDFNFYDGKVKGPTSYNEGITDVTEGYLPTYSTSSGEETLYLEQRNIVKNTTTNTSYGSFNAAFNACPDNETCNLQVLESNFVTGLSTIPANKEIILDFNEKTIHTSKNNYFINNGTLTVKNGTLDVIGSYTITNYKQPMFENNGILNVATDMVFDGNNYAAAAVLQNNWTGTININDGEFKSDFGFIYVINYGGTVNVNDGTFTGKNQNIIQTYGSFKNEPVTYEGAKVQGLKGSIYLDRTRYKYYYPIDLTGYSGDVKVTPVFDNYYAVTYTYQGSQTIPHYEWNKMNLTESTEEPEWTELDFGQTQDRLDYTVQGGKVYYLHVNNVNSFSLFDILIENNGNIEHELSRGSLQLAGGTITNKSAAVTSNCTDINFTGTTFRATDAYPSKAIEANKNTNLYITSGATVVERGLFKATKAYVSVDGVSVSNASEAFEASSDAVVDVYNMNYSYVDENSISKQIKVINPSYSDAVVNIYNMNINIDVIDSSEVHGISNGGNVHVYNATVNIKNTGTGKTYGIYASSGTATIDNMTTTVQGPKSYGIYMYGGNVVIGSHADGTAPSTTNPHFTGELNGMYNYYGKLYFYDGKFTSTGEGSIPMYGNVEDIPEGYRIVAQGNSFILGLESAIEDTFELNGIYYQTLEMPINVISQTSSKKGTINVWNSAILGNSVTIPNKVNVTLALQGHSLDFSGPEVGITNNGTLTIIDGNQDDIDVDTFSYVTNANGTAIQNNGTLVIGVAGNKNPQSPIISGNVAVAGTAPTVNSGSVTSTGNTGASRNNILSRLIQPSFSYKYNDLAVNKLSSNTILAEMPNIRAVEDLSVWTNQDLSVGMTSHNLAVMNVFSGKDNTCQKSVKYTVEVYKNGELDEFNSFEYIVNKYCLEDNTLRVDLDYFDGIETRYKDYILTKVVVNQEETTKIPEVVDDLSVFKLYYDKKSTCEGGECHGVEIENPKTGRFSYARPFLIAFILSSIIVLSIALIKLIKRKECI